MPNTPKTPCIKETAFSCPHCGAYSTQYWYEGYAKFLRDPRLPFIPDERFEKKEKESTGEPELKAKFMAFIQKMRSKQIFLSERAEHDSLPRANNLFLSGCYNCKKLSVWVNEDLVYPNLKFGSIPNRDLPPNIIAIIDEARAILDESPRGAAALLRLSIQMLCKELGESGKKLDDAIANLVKKGLSPIVQKSLDIVRVIGNEAVHPGTIDLNDNKDTARELFSLVNLIAEQMISIPKKVDSLYEKLPPEKRTAIEERDKKSQ